jgi:rhodanese-related sulfurtransferase
MEQQPEGRTLTCADLGDTRLLSVASEPEPTSADRLLELARAALVRLTPREAIQAAERGDLLIDIRPVEQRQEAGLIPGAHIVSRNALEWRLDPRSAHRNPELARTECKLILICDEGYQSSLAAATLRSFGLDATDIIGGAQAWLRTGLPIEKAPRS